MRYATLGKTDIKVSVVAMGCWAIVGDATWGPQDESQAIEAIHAALDAGITLFDTAEGYGDGYSETLLGKAIGGHRDKVVIASKVSASNARPADLKKACEQSLRRLCTDYIDLYQIHWPNREVPFVETWKALEELKQEGKVRAVGVCNFGPKDLAKMPNTPNCVSNQLPYNLLFRALEYDILPRCVEKNISVLCYSPLAQGLLTGKFTNADEVPKGRARTRHFAKTRPGTRHGEAGCETETFDAVDALRNICDRIGRPMSECALAWLIHQPGVSSVLAGARSPAQAIENAKAGDLLLSPDDVAAMSRATEPVKNALGPNPDMWQAESRMQ